MLHQAHPTSHALLFLALGMLAMMVTATARPAELIKDDPSPARIPASYLDKNGDGVISREEFLSFRGKLLLGQDQDRPHWESAARFAFAACDIDGNGELSLAELRTNPECGF